MVEKNFTKRFKKGKGYNRKSTAKQTAKFVQPKELRAGGMLEYKMSPDEVDSLLKNRKGQDAKKDAQEFLCDYVNEQYGLLGTCIRVLVN